MNGGTDKIFINRYLNKYLEDFFIVCTSHSSKRGKMLSLNEYFRIQSANRAGIRFNGLFACAPFFCQTYPVFSYGP